MWRLPGCRVGSKQEAQARCRLRLALPDIFGPIFEIVLEVSHEFAGVGTVNGAVVKAEREALDAPNCDGVLAVFVGEDDGLFVEAADTEDCGLWLGNDGRAELFAKDAGVSEREGAA